MAKELRWAVALGLLGATAVGLLVAYAVRDGNWINVLTFVGVVFLIINALIQE